MSLPSTHETSPLRPFTAMAWGLLVVVLDLRIESLDLIADPLGWTVMAVAAGRLARAFPVTSGFRVAQAAAVAALPVSLLMWLGATGWVLGLADIVLTTTFVFAVCTGVMAVVPARRQTADRIRWADLALGILPLAVLGPDPLSGDVTSGAGTLVPLVVVLVVAAFAVLIWFLVLLFSLGRTPDPTAAASVTP